jgi:predicted RNase H-like HicB family nuclease
MVLKVLVHQADEGGFWAEVPALPGCVTQAESMPDLILRAKESIEAYLGLGDEQPIPDGVSVLEVAV